MVGKVNDSIRCLPALLAQDDTAEPHVAAGRILEEELRTTPDFLRENR